MPGKTNTKQICVFKTQKTLIEFMDDTHYEKEAMAWPHTYTSRLRINAKDYSKGTGDLAVDAFYNLSPDEFYRLHTAIIRAKTISAQEVARGKRNLVRLQEAKSLKDGTLNIQGFNELKEFAEQFKSSPNEVFSEAGEKLVSLISGLSVSGTTSNGSEGRSLDQIIAEAASEVEEMKKAKEIFSEIKILNYDKYANPQNAKERRVTMLRVVYMAERNYPYLITVANGWGEPLITKLKGVMIKEGSTHYTSTVNIYMDEKNLFPMLKRLEVFLQAMTIHGLASYYETVTNPVLFYEMNDPEDEKG